MRFSSLELAGLGAGLQTLLYAAQSEYLLGEAVPTGIAFAAQMESAHQLGYFYQVF
ncbi:MAG: hypothetical protein WCS95_09925 [Lentisphaeria bacterium]